MFDMTIFVPRELHLPLAALGRVPWLATHWLPKDDPRTEGHLASEARINYPLVMETAGPAMAMLMRTLMAEGQGTQVRYLEAVGRCLAVGPRAFRPDVDTCRALDHVDIPLGFEDYAQPFDAMILVLPRPWVDEVLARFPGARPFHLLMVAHKPDEKSVFVAAVDGPSSISLRATLRPRPGLETIEEVLRSHRDEPDFHLVEAQQRMALNLALLLTQVGTRVAGWLEPDRHDKHRRLADRGDERGRRLVAGDIREVTPVRALDLWTTLVPPTEGGGSTHASPHAHWRRGHWHTFRTGPGRTLRTRKLLPPIWVRGPEVPQGADYVVRAHPDRAENSA